MLLSLLFMGVVGLTCRRHAPLFPAVGHYEALGFVGLGSSHNGLKALPRTESQTHRNHTGADERTDRQTDTLTTTHIIMP